MANNLDASLKQKKLKQKLTIYTVIYVVLFPILAYAGWLSPMAVDSPRGASIFLALFIVFIILLMPISVPVSIYLMWSRYCSKKYDKARRFALLPLYTIILVFVMLEITSWLERFLSKIFNAG